MSHHSDQPIPPEIIAIFDDLKLGATGQFPKGKMDQHDQGEIKIAICSKDNKVILAFGKEVAWIGFTKAEALNIAETLIKHAANCT